MAATTTQTLLVVDDSDDDREVFKRLFLASAQDMWQVIEAEDGEEACKHIQAESISAVLLDYSLPGDNGLVTLDQLLSMKPYLPIVMLTGQGSEKLAADAMRRGAQDYIAKDQIKSVSLERTVVRAIDRIEKMRQLDERNEELRLFASTLAHDLKSPARNMRNIVSFLVEDMPVEYVEQSREHMQMLTGASLRLTRLIDDLHAYTQLDTRSVKDAQDIELNDVIQIVLDELSVDIKNKQANISYSELPMLPGQMSTLIQLFQNLIGNALKYCEADIPTISIQAKKENKHWIITIKDNGIGIEAQYFDYVFIPFRRLHGPNKYIGSGLGLATCKKIVTRHHGKLWCESEKGTGSTFYVSLPADTH